VKEVKEREEVKEVEGVKETEEVDSERRRRGTTIAPPGRVG
jgi:hypothetical protein